ncbi:hypothetical protein PUN28_009611 [Cardiocondyla obscurior]|uniref:Uncharacterized protein n=1 Tax=Cardiocondyla obscurior TaxID=286306 RepID=A0AAW2FTL1_9HYME
MLVDTYAPDDDDDDDDTPDVTGGYIQRIRSRNLTTLNRCVSISRLFHTCTQPGGGSSRENGERSRATFANLIR